MQQAPWQGVLQEQHKAEIALLLPIEIKEVLRWKYEPFTTVVVGETWWGPLLGFVDDLWVLAACCLLRSKLIHLSETVSLLSPKLECNDVIWAH
ncbi:hypothetical protein AAY473_009956 [Plecturocebus cupreus]